MKLVGVVTLAGAVIAAPLIVAGSASALPESSCDGAGCVPGVPHDAVEGAACVSGTRWAFGMNASGTKTFICSSRSQWVPTKPLIGVRPLGAPCDGAKDKGSAQTPDGIPMTCKGTNWIGDYDAIFYSKTY
jgi:hypothetical protein